MSHKFPYKTYEPHIPPSNYKVGMGESYYTNGTHGTYLVDQLTEEAVQVIENSKDNPFLLVLSHYHVHGPLQAPEEEVEKYSEVLPKFPTEYQIDPADGTITKIHRNNPTQAAMMEAMDRSVGQVMDALKTNGILDKTVVIFTSDNGGKSTVSSLGYPKLKGMTKGEKLRWVREGAGRGALGTSNLPLKYGKNWMYEGGIRVPLIVYDPDTVPSVSQCPATGTDIFPTMLDLAGLPLTPDEHIDGYSLKSEVQRVNSPRMCQNKKFMSRNILWHNGSNLGKAKYGTPSSSAIRRGKWKMIYNNDENSVELFNIIEDEGEENDISETRSDVVESLNTTLRLLIEEVEGSDVEYQ